MYICMYNKQLRWVRNKLGNSPCMEVGGAVCMRHSCTGRLAGAFPQLTCVLTIYSRYCSRHSCHSQSLHTRTIVASTSWNIMVNRSASHISLGNQYWSAHPNIYVHIMFSSSVRDYSVWPSASQAVYVRWHMGPARAGRQASPTVCACMQAGHAWHTHTCAVPHPTYLCNLTVAVHLLQAFNSISVYGY